MKIIYIIPLFFIFGSVLFSKAKLTVGMNAPDFQLSDQDSKIHNLSDYRGSSVILYFFPMADTPG